MVIEMENDVLSTLAIIMKSKNISVYRLAQLSSVPQSTLNSLFSKNNIPSIATLDHLVAALNMTLVDFFTYLKAYQNLSKQGKSDLSMDDLLIYESSKEYVTQPHLVLSQRAKLLDSDELEVFNDLVELFINKNKR